MWRATSFSLWGKTCGIAGAYGLLHHCQVNQKFSRRRCVMMEECSESFEQQSETERYLSQAKFWYLSENHRSLSVPLDVSERAMTISQLRSMRELLKRLCKTRLLKDNSQYAKDKGTFGKPIDWFEINMFQIVDEVVKKVIPETEAKSWAEFVACGPQKPRILVSHSWSGHFRDFMVIIDHLQQDKSLSVEDGIWVCTFAMSQFGNESFGEKLKDSPFVKAVEAAMMTVLLVDRNGDSLKRSWCGLEMQHSIAKDKELELYTTSGVVGGSRSSGGPLVEALKRWDIRSTETTVPAQRRQILSYIAKRDELSGLQTSGDGSLILHRGRAILQDGSEDYEACLIKDCSEVFEDLNMLVRTEALVRIGKVKRPQGCKVSRMEHRGVTLAQLRKFTRRVQFERGKDVTVSEVEEHCLKPLVFTHRRSYMELESDCAQKPQYYIEYASNAKVHDIMTAIEWFVEAKELPDSTIVFMYILANDYSSWDITTPATGYFRPPDDAAWLKMMTTSTAMFAPVRECVAVLACVDHNVQESFNRTWRLALVELFVRTGRDVYFGFPTGVMACTTPFETGVGMFGHLELDIAQAFQLLDVGKSKTKYDADKRFLRKTIWHDDPQCFKVTENRLQRWFAGVILRDAAARDDVEAVLKVCCCPGLSINSQTLKGAHGETALHICAASGSSAALQTLLKMGADPDAEDSIGERPLHYAAFTGQSSAATMLVEGGANLWCESFLGETPLQVAQQNVGRFWGVDSGDVARFLQQYVAPR